MRFENFIKEQKPAKIIIIGHGLGDVDFPYFRKLNELLPDNIEICYWLYNLTELQQKKKVLKQVVY